jgi:hypothetical protein
LAAGAGWSWRLPPVTSGTSTAYNRFPSPILLANHNISSTGTWPAFRVVSVDPQLLYRMEIFFGIMGRAGEKSREYYLKVIML